MNSVNADKRKIGNRLTLLITLLALGLAGHYGFEHVQSWLREPDYSQNPDGNARVGYCMVRRFTVNQKSIIADTQLRPPSEELSAAVLPVAMDGLQSDEARKALRALRQRQEIRQQAEQVVNAAAESCGFWGAGVALGVTPLDLATKWLSHDAAFTAFLKSGPTVDAASLFYDKQRIEKRS